MPNKHPFVYHLVAEWLYKFYQPTDSPSQNDAGKYQGKLLNVVGDARSFELFFDDVDPNNRWDDHVEGTHYDVDSIECTSICVHGQLVWSELNSPRKLKVAQGENPVG
jgi:hypothetical protein